MDEQPDLMSALKASLDAVKARDGEVMMSKHDAKCLERKAYFPLLCSCGVSDEEFQLVKERVTRSEMTPAQQLAHRYAAEAGRRSDALRAFRECMRYVAIAEANGDTTSAAGHRADARATLHMYPALVEGLEGVVGGGWLR